MKKSRSVAAVTKIAGTYAGNAKKQIKELKRCLKEGQASGDLLMVGAAYCCLAEAYSDLDDLHGVLVNALKAVTVLKDTDEYEMTVKAYSALGHAYTYQGNHQMALVCDETAYGLVKKHRIKGKLRIITLNNLSVSYHAMEETRKSIKFLGECIDLLKKDGDPDYTDLVMYSINLAGCYKDVGEREYALQLMGSLSGWLDKVAFKPLVCDYYLRKAIILYLLGDVTAGGEAMDEAFAIFPENVYPLPLYDDLCEVSRHVIDAGDRDRAKKILGLMKIYAEKNPGTLEQLFAARMTANYYKSFGKYKLASGYFEKCEELNERQLREIKEIQMKLHNTTQNTEPSTTRGNNNRRRAM